MQKIKGIIFDFNGVMVDDYALQKRAWSEISKMLRNRPVTDDEMVRKIRGVPTKDTILWMASEELDQSRLSELAQVKTAITQQLFEQDVLQLTAGLPAFLDQSTRQKIRLTIATSQTPEVFHYLFRKLGLKRWFNEELVVCHDGTYPGKPAPDAYLIAAHRLNLAPKECIVFEDAPSGIAAARAAGIGKIIAIGNGASLGTLPGVAKVVRDFSDVGLKDIVY